MKHTTTALTSPAPVSQKVKEFMQVQKASGPLYRALEEACGIHEDHSAYFRINSSVNLSTEESTIIHFNMAFTSGPNSLSDGIEPVWIAVDSTLENLNQPPSPVDKKIETQSSSTLSMLSINLKRDIEVSCTASNKRVKAKSVTFAASSQSSVSGASSLIAAFLADPTLPDFCEQHDFCHHVQKRGPPTFANKKLGYFQKGMPCKHFVYFAPPIATVRHALSLREIINSVAQNSNRDGFLQHERLQLARQLASAVLQFHQTPLLKHSWRSSDVVFFGQNPSSMTLTTPHLNVRIGKGNQLHLTGTEKISIDGMNRGFIRNPYMFGLGVILIELAYQAPLSSLRKAEDSVDDQENKYTDFFTANRVSRLMGSSLGVSYAKVVRRCLGCDFGEDTDLNAQTLQSAFYRDVVCELERLERAFGMLQLG